MIRVEALVVDDHKFVCESIGAMMEKSGLLGKVHVAFTGEEALELFKTKHIKLALVDARMPGMSGLELAKTILQEYPTVRVIGMTSFGEDDTILDMLRTKFHGILLKRSTNSNEINKCLHEVLQGRSYYTADVQAGIDNHEYNLLQPPRTIFTKREKEILIYICQGKSSKEIAKLIGLSDSTVEGYRKEMLHRTQTSNSSELVAFTLRNGIV